MLSFCRLFSSLVEERWNFFGKVSKVKIKKSKIKKFLKNSFMLWVGGSVILGLKGLFIMRFLFRQQGKKFVTSPLTIQKRYIFLEREKKCKNEYMFKILSPSELVLLYTLLSIITRDPPSYTFPRCL